MLLYCPSLRAHLKSRTQSIDEENVGVNDENVDFTGYEKTLNSCDIVDELQMLRQRVSQLEAELDFIKKSAKKSLFHLENTKEKDELVKFYTGFPDYATLFTFHETLLESDASVGWKEFQQEL